MALIVRRGVTPPRAGALCNVKIFFCRVSENSILPCFILAHGTQSRKRRTEIFEPFSNVVLFGVLGGHFNHAGLSAVERVRGGPDAFTIVVYYLHITEVPDIPGSIATIAEE